MDAALLIFDAGADHPGHGHRLEVAVVRHRPEIGVHAAGVDAAHADVVRPGLLGQDLADALHGVLGGAVAARARIAEQAAAAEDVDDQTAALPGHQRIQLLDHAHRADAVQLEHIPQVLESQLGDAVLFGVGTGVVDQHIHGPEGAFHIAAEAAAFFGVRDVEALGIHPALPQLPEQRLHLFLTSSAQGQVVVLRQKQSQGPSDPIRRAGDDHGLFHNVPPDETVFSMPSGRFHYITKTAKKQGQSAPVKYFIPPLPAYFR